MELDYGALGDDFFDDPIEPWPDASPSPEQQAHTNTSLNNGSDMTNIDPALFATQKQVRFHNQSIGYQEEDTDVDNLNGDLDEVSDDNDGRMENDYVDDGEELVSEADSDFDINNLGSVSNIGGIIDSVLEDKRGGSAVKVKAGKSSGRSDRGRGGRGRRGRKGRGDSTGRIGTSEPIERRGRPKIKPQKGVKRGFRKPLDPTSDFKQLHYLATQAYLDEDHVTAEEYASQAVLENPEMYTAHILLSEIYIARGDHSRAVIAMFNGAHTRPRDTETWKSVAELVLKGEDEANAHNAVLDAIYCYNRIIGVETDNIEPRIRRAELNFMAKNYSRAIYDYWRVKATDPFNLEILKRLAQCFVAINARHKAIECYDEAIEHYRNLEPQKSRSFKWSDVNIYVELFTMSDRWQEGLSKLRQVARWILGRTEEDFWDRFEEDDREFDIEDEPRRTQVTEFTPGLFDPETYGLELPVEIRVKFGIFRLNLGGNHIIEAQRHFEYLEPETALTKGMAHTYYDVFIDIGDALRNKSLYEAALRFYEPISHLEGLADPVFWTSMATCYRELHQLHEAESCYRTVVDLQQDKTDAQMELAVMFDTAGVSAKARHYRDEARDRRKRTYSRRMQNSGIVDAIGIDPTDVEDPDVALQSVELGEEEELDAQGLLAYNKGKTVTGVVPKLPPRTSRRKVINHDSLQPHFSRMDELKSEYLASKSPKVREDWMSCAKTVISRFRQVRIFFPQDKHFKFYGYSAKARRRQFLSVQEQETWVEPSDDDDPNESKEPEPIDTYAGVQFSEWLDCFLQYAMILAETNQYHASFQVIEFCIDCIVFYHDPQLLFTIHVVDSILSIMAKDYRRLNEDLRWFMRERQFLTDSYRMFAALNRLAMSDNPWYNHGPTQKFVLRHLKSMDWSIAPAKDRARSMYDERATLTTRDENGEPIEATEMDTVLLMIYGHVLYAGQSYAYALNYFYRAYTLDPTHPMIILSLSSAYIHYAFKRQSENRQTILMQGLSFLYDYYEIRQQSPHAIERQEAEFNVGRTYNLVGLLHLAIPRYERVLDMSEEVKSQMVDGELREDFAREAAFALQCLWLQNGQVEKAREVTERWLTV